MEKLNMLQILKLFRNYNTVALQNMYKGFIEIDLELVLFHDTYEIFRKHKNIII